MHADCRISGSMTTATTTSCVPEASRDAGLDAVEKNVGYQDDGLVKATNVSHSTVTSAWTYAVNTVESEE